jgi:hypothetical protein
MKRNIAISTSLEAIFSLLMEEFQGTAKPE